MLLTNQQSKGTLIKRYKRFLADITLPDKSEITVHCPNSGSMKGCSSPGMEVIISRSDNPRRKYPWTLEMVHNGVSWIGVNTSMTNKIVHEALDKGIIKNIGKITAIRPEIKVGAGSRLDFLVTTDKEKIYIEVKNCSLSENRVAMFPDAVTKRGTKHLLELSRLKQEANCRAIILFCIQREDADSFRPAREIDQTYAKTLQEVQMQGVEVMAWQTRINPQEIIIYKQLPVNLQQEE